MNDSRYSLNKEEDGALNSNGPYSPVMVEDVHMNHASNSKRSRILAFMIILLLLTCAVLIVLYAMERGKRKDSVHTVKEEESSLTEKVCTSVHCVRTASVILDNLNQEVDPCKDFYSFSCGGWQREHPIPDTEADWTQVEELKLSNGKTLRRLLDSRETRKKYSKIAAVQKVYDYYDACTNIMAIEKAGIAPLKDTITKYGSWNMTDYGFKGKWDFYKYLASIHRELNIKPLFKISVNPDIKNSSIYRIMIEQTSHTISRKSYLSSNNTYLQKVASAYKRLMQELAKLLGAKVIEKGEQLVEIFELEKSLSKISLPKEETVNEIKLYKLLTIKELTNYSGNELDWQRILNEIFKETQISFKSSDSVVVLGLDYIKNLGLLLKRTPKRVVRNYMIWQIVVTLAQELGSVARPALHRFKSVVDGTISGTISVWEHCIKEMSRSIIGYPLGLIFIDEKFHKESLDEISKLIHDLREVFLSNLNDLDWMDDQTKEKAREKAEAIRKNIGYPKFLKNQEELDTLYKEFKTRRSYFSSQLNLRQFTVYKRLSLLNQPVDKNRWIIPPQTVNAFYDRVTNKITFPAGFLQPPFFDKHFPRAVSYGGIGIVVAHEITHGFDSNGRKFDKMGDQFNWWTNSSNDAFERKSQCFIEQYSYVKAYGMNLNGVQTLGENIADNAAIKHAFMAYKHWVKTNGEEPRLPGMEYSNDQVFFISAAQVDCGNIRSQTAKLAIEQGTHTLSKYRVNLEMANSMEFSKAFKCPLNSPMNPERKCEVW